MRGERTRRQELWAKPLEKLERRTLKLGSTGERGIGGTRGEKKGMKKCHSAKLGATGRKFVVVDGKKGEN